MRLLVTGATGFVGSGLLRRLALESGREVVAATRTMESDAGLSGNISGPASFAGSRLNTACVGNIHGETDWTRALDQVDVVIHTAARVHVMHETAVDSLAEFRRVNVEGALNLARQAVKAGVKRFVFLSSIKVNGESTRPRQVFFADDSPHPQDAYAVSKHEAETGLRQIAAESGLELVIVRPPLVYGPGVRANFLSLIKAVARGIPLPLGAIHNRRSLVGLDNLLDFIMTCADHSAAANQTFLVSDAEDLSTADLVRHIAQAMNKPAHLIPVPVFVLEAGAALVGKRHVAQRLCSNLQVDTAKNRALLGWIPPFSVDEGLRQTVAPWRG